MDVSMKGGVSVVSKEECDTTRGGKYCVHLVSFLWEEVLPVNVCCCFRKQKATSSWEGSTAILMLPLNPCSPNWRHFNPCDEQ